jgi:FKBP-type peptidyl-prolyl cis-trans isomerase
MKRGLNINIQIYIIFAFMLVVTSSQLTSCKNEPKKLTNEEAAKYKEPLVGVNKILVEKDQEKIKSYIKRRKWDMQMTETGMWYKILKEGKGEVVKTGDIVVLDYEVSLLNGKYCYSSDSTGYLKFVVGRGGVESGLEEGILLLHVGDSARFIMPPHLAHGLVGDDKMIPTRSTIIYKLKLLEIYNQ